MNAGCATHRGELTEQLLLGLPLTAELSRHLAECAWCARELGEISEVVATLHRAESSFRGAHRAPAPLESPPVPGPWITERIPAHGPGRKRRFALLAAAAAIIGGAALVPLLHSGTGGAANDVALARVGYMVAHPWGTEVPIALTGLHLGQTYHLLTADAAGDRAPAGSVRATGDRTVRARMVTAMSRGAITVLMVADQGDDQVAAIPIDSPLAEDPPG